MFVALATLLILVPICLAVWVVAGMGVTSLIYGLMAMVCMPIVVLAVLGGVKRVVARRQDPVTRSCDPAVKDTAGSRNQYRIGGVS